jgi:hypothetical protein
LEAEDEATDGAEMEEEEAEGVAEAAGDGDETVVEVWVEELPMDAWLPTLEQDTC